MRNRSTRIGLCRVYEIHPFHWMEWLIETRLISFSPITSNLEYSNSEVEKKKKKKGIMIEATKRKSIVYVFREKMFNKIDENKLFSDNFKWLILFHSSLNNAVSSRSVLIKNKVQGSRQVDRRGLESETIHFSRFLRWRGSWWSSNHPLLPFVLSWESQFSLLRAEVAVFVAKIVVGVSTPGQAEEENS